MSSIVKNMTKLKLSIEVEIVADGDGYVAYSKDLKGVVANGSKISDTVKNYLELTQFHIMCLLKTNRKIPASIISKNKTITKKVSATGSKIRTKIIHPELQFA